MKTREFASALGESVLSTHGTSRALEREVLRVLVPEEASDVAPGDVVMPPPGTALSAADVDAFARQGAVALALKGSGSDAVLDAAESAEITVLHINPAVGWHHALTQLTWALDSSVGWGDGTGDDFTKDLFSLAETTSMALHGAVAIMNDYAQIVAYSSQPDQRVDQVRADGILGRRVPNDFAKAHGAVRTWAAGDVRVVEAPGTFPRLVTPVRVGEKFLGSIWLILPTDEVTPSMRTAIAAAANLAAVHLMRYSSTQSSSAWRVNQSFVRNRLLGAESRSTERGTFIVLAVVPRGDMTAEEELLREQLLALVGFAVAAWSGGGSAVVDDVIYVLLPVDEGASERAVAVAEDIVRRAEETIRQEVAIGLSAPTNTPAGQRHDALEAANWQARTGPGVAVFGDVMIQLTLERLASLVAGAGVNLPQVTALREHDRNHGTEYAPTLLAYLANGGNVAAAAARLHVHGNSLRYRLKRVRDLFDITLDGPDERLAVWLFLRLSETDIN